MHKQRLKAKLSFGKKRTNCVGVSDAYVATRFDALTRISRGRIIFPHLSIYASSLGLPLTLP